MLTVKQSNKIKRALKALEDVRKELDLQSDNEVNWYLEDGGNLNLIDGNSHTGRVCDPNYGMVIGCFNLPNSSGGGW